jgi:hypothetical protein
VAWFIDSVVFKECTEDRAPRGLTLTWVAAILTHNQSRGDTLNLHRAIYNNIKILGRKTAGEPTELENEHAIHQ